MFAVRQWTFAPARRNGTPVASRIRVPFHFAPPAPTPAIVEPRTHPNGPEYDDAGAPLDAGDAGQPPTRATPAPTPRPPKRRRAAEDVMVRGRLEAPRPRHVRLPGAGRRAASRAAHQRVRRAQLAPGFLLTNEGGSGHAEQVFLRGFDAHEGQDLEFSVDGVPINDAGNYHGNGYADTHFIIPELIQSVRVLEGPYAPQQGDFAVAGSADYHLGLDRRGLTAEYTVGNYGTQRMLMLWGPSDAPSGTFAGAEYFTTDGFGVNRQAKRGTAHRPGGNPGRTTGDAAPQRDGVRDGIRLRGRRPRGRLPVGSRRLLRHRGPGPGRQHRDPRVHLRHLRESLQGHRRLPTILPHRALDAPARELDGFLDRRAAPRRRRPTHSAATSPTSISTRRRSAGAASRGGTARRSGRSRSSRGLLRPRQSHDVDAVPRHGRERRPVPHRRRPHVEPRRHRRVRRR